MTKSNDNNKDLKPWSTLIPPINMNNNEELVLVNSNNDYKLCMMIGYPYVETTDVRQITFGEFKDFLYKNFTTTPQANSENVQNHYAILYTADENVFNDSRSRDFVTYTSPISSVNVKETLVNHNYLGFYTFVSLITKEELERLNGLAHGFEKIRLLGHFIELIGYSKK